MLLLIYIIIVSRTQLVTEYSRSLKAPIISSLESEQARQELAEWHIAIHSLRMA